MLWCSPGGWQFFDSDANGAIDVEEFVQGMSGKGGSVIHQRVQQLAKDLASKGEQAEAVRGDSRASKPEAWRKP